MSIREKIDLNEVVDFTQRLIRVPSESKQEGDVAELIAEEMRKLGFDEVEVDSMFNVVGRIKGDGSGNSLLLNSHIDHAEPGAMKDPYSAIIMDGTPFGSPEPVIYGRAACDMKGAVACMVYAAAAAKRSGIPLKGDVIVGCNSREELSAAEGVLYMLDQGKVHADMAICGESTGLHIYLGHRGNAEVKVTVKGKMSHASNPKRGHNAVIMASEFISYLLQKYALPKHELLGECTITVLDIETDSARNAPVVPDRCHIYIDRRFLPGETQTQILDEFRGHVERAKEVIPHFEADLEITKWGIALYTPEEELVVQKLMKAREKVMGGAGPVSAWIFGTDGAFVADRGIPTVGFGPGDEHFAHTPEDHIPFSHLEKATHVYAQAIAEICG